MLDPRPSEGQVPGPGVPCGVDTLTPLASEDVRPVAGLAGLCRFPGTAARLPECQAWVPALLTVLATCPQGLTEEPGSPPALARGCPFQRTLESLCVHPAELGLCSRPAPPLLG